MRAFLILTFVMAGATAPAYPAALRLGSLVDSQSGTSFDADLRFSPTERWSVGAGVGKSESDLAGSEFAGTSLRLSSDVNLGGFNATVALQQWKDTDQIESTSVRAELGWMTQSGFAVSALLDNRQMSVEYATVTLGGQARQAQVDFDSSGLGLDVSWLGEQWNVGARFLGYSHGRSIDRVQAILNAPTTARFPKLAALGDSIVTRAAAAPERELSFTIGREFTRSSVQGDWISQRDALTQADVNSLSVTHGFRFNPHVEMNTTLGFSAGGDNDTTSYGGLSLTLRN